MKIRFLPALVVLVLTAFASAQAVYVPRYTVPRPVVGAPSAAVQQEVRVTRYTQTVPQKVVIVRQIPARTIVVQPPPFKKPRYKNPYHQYRADVWRWKHGLYPGARALRHYGPPLPRRW